LSARPSHKVGAFLKKTGEVCWYTNKLRPELLTTPQITRSSPFSFHSDKWHYNSADVASGV